MLVSIRHLQCESSVYQFWRRYCSSGVSEMLKHLCLAAFAVTVLFATPQVIAVDIDGVIHPITVDLLAHALDQAASQNGAAVLLRLNTPGGLLDATREMNEKIVASRVPVIAYVTPSGGR